VRQKARFFERTPVQVNPISIIAGRSAANSRHQQTERGRQAHRGYFNLPTDVAGVDAA
jgi:hypothetical protein